MRKLLALVAVGIVLAVIVGVVADSRVPTLRLVAHFTRTVGVQAGSEVRVLGVKIGDVVSVHPEGRTVRVELRYDARYAIPADAQAVIVPPSIVSDRYVQLTPAYTSGPRLSDRADIPVDRTVVPLELDDIYRALDEFNKALGPDGANANGDLSKLIDTAKANLEGNGANLGATLDNLSQALSTLANGRQDLFGTIANLQQFTTMLARSDAQVRQFNQQLATVSQQLAAERDDLAAALHSLAAALADITSFVKDNRAELTANVSALADLTGVLVRQQQAIVNVLDVAPLALSNLNLAYNSRSGTIDTRDNVLGPYDPASFVCSLMVTAVPVPQIPKECFALAQALHAKGLPLTAELNRLLGLPPGSSPSGGVPAGATGSPVVPAAPDLPGGPEQSSDPTLGGILP
jgi:phospholipid/cholesterol/gamma-HCH transport system substrate-binding protein